MRSVRLQLWQFWLLFYSDFTAILRAVATKRMLLVLHQNRNQIVVKSHQKSPVEYTGGFIQGRQERTTSEILPLLNYAVGI